MQKRIYDCFTYFNEDQLLKLRLETLWDVVDYFVICESVLTHTGKSKPINFNINNFKKYESKIRYILIDSYDFESSNPWVYENYQRNYLSNGFTDAVSEDWIMVSDLDEIPNPAAIKNFNPNRYLRASFEQTVYLYYLNNMVFSFGKPSVWSMPKITTFENYENIFKSPQNIRLFKSTGVFRGLKRAFINLRTQKIKNGGWHFTWMGGVEKIILKLKNTAHQEFNRPENLNPSEIERKIRSGGSPDILNRDGSNWSIKLVELDDNLPIYLSNNANDFSNLLLTTEDRLP
jgi:beta-1,4-mannosyl-glycoprotein beta-1,4-N-acetylglucosaminyltransferase